MMRENGSVSSRSNDARRPGRGEGEPLDLDDARQVANSGVPNVDRHLNQTRRRADCAGLVSSVSLARVPRLSSRKLQAAC